jgi:hypothetical protein
VRFAKQLFTVSCSSKGDDEPATMYRMQLIDVETGLALLHSEHEATALLRN